MLEDGASWSGRERNCAFLNLGAGPAGDVGFATISAVSGLDYLDDGRAHALVDWDRDGDEDLWTTNRTAPRIRFLRNDQAAGHHYLAVRLVGTRCNRDAIGARVEVLIGEPPVAGQLMRTLRAGEGFLAQSSKWLHFGLGEVTAVEAVIVHWPDGTSQTVRGIEVDGFHEITQGVSTAQPVVSLANDDGPLKSEAMAPPPSSDAARILLSSRLPLPPIPMTRFDGSADDLARFQGQPVWLSLWASWCTPCLKELHDMAAEVARLRAAGLNVVALSLDGFDQPGMETTTIEDAKVAIERLAFPFESAVATAETIRRLRFADGQVFGRQSEIVLPSSYLLTATGQLAAIYRGPVTVERLLADVAHLRDDDPALLAAALPFPGIWFDGRRRFTPLAIVADLIDHQDMDSAAEYVRANMSDLAQQPGYVQVVGTLGTALASGGRIRAAVEMYRRALDADPHNVPVLNNLAWHLATHEQPTIRDPREAVRHAEAAARLTKYQSAAVLDTLATAYAAARQTAQAGTTWDQAIQLALQQHQADLAARLRRKRAELDE
jgi:thiol-disulfide isomerase/thioredoxin